MFKFSKDSLQWLLSKEGNKLDRSKFEETENTHTPKNAKNLGGFFGFPNFIKRFISNCITRNILTNPLKELLQKEDDFNWTGICNKVFGKLKLCMNSDTCVSYFDESIYRERIAYTNTTPYGV